MGGEVRRLREARGLRPAELARRAGVSPASLRDWEIGRHRPGAAALERLLLALGADARTRAEALARIDAPEARVALAHTPWGAPVDLGEVLRAMRRRAGTAQADVARAVGVRQGTLAKWEGGGATPAEETLDRLFAALRATPEETAALHAVRHGPAAPLDDPLERLRVATYERPVALRDVLLLGLEAELWSRAMREPALDAPLAQAMATRAQQALIRGAWSEIEPHARRAARLAPLVGDLDVLGPALYARNWVRQRRAGGARVAARSLGRWADRMRAPLNRTWLTGAGALALVRAGETEAGVRVVRALLDEAAPGTRDRAYHGEDLVEAWLLAGEPERAAETLEGLGGDASPLAAAKVAAARGETPPPGFLAGLRAGDDVLGRIEADRIERLAAAVRRGRPARLR